MRTITRGVTVMDDHKIVGKGGHGKYLWRRIGQRADPRQDADKGGMRWRKTENPARAQAAANTRKLIEWAAEAVSKPLPEAVRRRAATILSDDIGAMVAGLVETQVAARARRAARAPRPARPKPPCSPRARRALDRYAAASANGMAITWCELDEGFRNASCHGGAYTIPALLAEAEAQGRSVEEVLRALAVAYEVTTRFALAFPFPVFNVHPHAAFATIGGAAAASLVRRQDAKHHARRGDRRRRACRFAGPFDTAVEGALIRNAWTAAGAWIGLRAARLGRGRDRRQRRHAVRRLRRRVQDAARFREALVEGLGERLVGDATATTRCSPAAATRTPRSKRRSTSSAACRKKKDDDRRDRGRDRRPAARRCARSSPRPCSPRSSRCRTPSPPPCSSAPPARAPSPTTSCEEESIAKLRQRVRLQPYPDVKPAPNDRPARVTMRFDDGAEMSAVVRKRARRRRQAVRRADAALEARGERRRRLPRGAGHAERASSGGEQGAPRHGRWREVLAGMVKL